MKTRKLLPIFSILFLIIILGVSCEKDRIDPINPPPPPPPAKTVSVNAEVVGIGGTINPSGITKLALEDSMEFSIIHDKNYKTKSIVINGINQPISNTLTVRADNELDNWDIKVEFALKDSVALISSYNWYPQKFEAQYFTQGDTEWHPMMVDSTWTYELYRTFNSKGEERTYYSDGNIGGGNYTLDDNDLKFEGDVTNYKVITLNKDSLVVESILSNKLDNSSTKYRDFYTHTPKM